LRRASGSRKLPRTSAPLKLVPKSAPSLGESTAEWESYVLRTWELDGAERRLLRMAGEAWDDYRGAREVLIREGRTTATGRGKAARLRVEYYVMERSRKAFGDLLKQLALEGAGDPESARRTEAK
jgi:hypothetical protein